MLTRIGATFADSRYVATDNVEDNITVSIIISSVVDLMPVTYNISCHIPDTSGNTAMQTRTMTVSLPADITKYCNGMTLVQIIFSVRYDLMNNFGAESETSGTGGADMILADDSRLDIRGRGGADRIIGGANPNVIYENGGHDEIDDRNGDDRMWGKSGHDVIHGNDCTSWSNDSKCDYIIIHGDINNSAIHSGKDPDTCPSPKSAAFGECEYIREA